MFLRSGGGEPFDSGHQNLSGVAAVIVRYGKYLDAIQLVFHNGHETSLFGSATGGVRKIFRVPLNDRITKAVVWSGNGVDAVQFHTQKGLKSQKFGGNGGKQREAMGCASGQQELVGIFGKCGRCIDSIQFKWETCVTTATATTASTTTATAVNTAAAASSSSSNNNTDGDNIVFVGDQNNLPPPIMTMNVGDDDDGDDFEKVLGAQPR